MQSIKLRSHVGEDGILHLDIPVGIADTDIEITVTVQPVTATPTDTHREKVGRLGFLKKLLGLLKMTL